MLVVFWPIFVADTKITFGYDFVAPLTPRFIKSWNYDTEHDLARATKGY